jgi:diacylglycerol kinase
MSSFFVSRMHSFGHALRGAWYVIRTQRNAWIHVAITIIVVLVSFWLGLNLRDWAVIILTVTIVFAAEFLNTAIEVVVDLASPQQHPLAKVAKDVGAATVLLAAFSAVLIGLLILGPPLWARVAPMLASR